MKKILIIRPSSIGDIVMASPMIDALRRGFPNASISWLVDPSAIDLLRFHPGLDEVIPWDKNKWKVLLNKGKFIDFLGELFRFSKEMRARHFDLVLDAQGLLRSRLLAWLTGAKNRIGFESKEPGSLFMTRIISRGPGKKRMGSEYEHMMRELGISPSPFISRLVLPEDDVKAAHRAISKAGISSPYAAFCPFTTRPQKHWVRERWSILAKKIHRDLGLPVVMLGGPGDRETGTIIWSKASESLVDLTGRLSLGQSCAIVRNSGLAIGVDTGLTHLAVALGRPTIALFGATCPYLQSENPKALVLYNGRPCSPCKRRPTCDGDFTCMKNLGPEDVIEAAKRVINNG